MDTQPQFITLEPDSDGDATITMHREADTALYDQAVAYMIREDITFCQLLKRALKETLGG